MLLFPVCVFVPLVHMGRGEEEYVLPVLPANDHRPRMIIAVGVQVVCSYVRTCRRRRRRRRSITLPSMLADKKDGGWSVLSCVQRGGHRRRRRKRVKANTHPPPPSVLPLCIVASSTPPPLVYTYVHADMKERLGTVGRKGYVDRRSSSFFLI